LRNSYSIEDNTRYLANLATKTRDDEYGMKVIAEATRMDSRAMKTIAQLTMVYLPGSFVAVSLSNPRFWHRKTIENLLGHIFIDVI
jgi:hypothetical protein